MTHVSQPTSHDTPPAVAAERADRFETKSQTDRYASPWSLGVRIKIALWQVTWLFLFRPSPKPLKAWRLFLLRLFGTRITGKPFVDSSCIIKMPWHLTLEDRACLGPKSEVYNLGHVTLKARSVVAQRVYLCTGTHDITIDTLPLVTAPITIGEECFIGACALILPGVTIGDGAVIGAGSVVTKDVEPWTIAAGNPAKPLGPRTFNRAEP